ncbi:MAG: hypothetical protein ACRKFN_11590 [Desulfitobacterium sp.]
MLYVKTKITDNFEIKVDLYDDEIFTDCPNCGKEIEVGAEDIKWIIDNGGDFVSYVEICDSCMKHLEKAK